MAFSCLFVAFFTVPANTSELPSPTAMDTLKYVAVVRENALYNQRPLTVEVYAKLTDSAHFNILVANEAKSSPTHWELFTFPQNGFLAGYLPGYSPDHIRSSTRVTDGRWHRFSMILTKTVGCLEVDGQEVARTTLQPKESLHRKPGNLCVGTLVSRQLGCEGEIAEVHLSGKGGTLGRWRFVATGKDVVQDLSSHKNPAERLKAPRTMDRFDITQLSSEEAAKFHTSRQIPAGKSLALLPPNTPAAHLRRRFDKAFQSLALSSIALAPQPRDTLLKDWEEQYHRIELRLKGEEKAPPKAEAQAYDGHALCWPEDGDPLGTVLRRTGALCRRLRDFDINAELKVLEANLERLVRMASKTPLRDTEARKDLFLLACALNRQIAFSNPLLDFDEILFVARGDYLGSRFTGPKVTTDAYGQHFATQYFAFNSVPGGGLFVVHNFKTEPEVTNLLEGVAVEKGRLRGKELLPGAFLSPDLSFDGKEIVFAYTENGEHRWRWTPQTSWNLFRMKRDGTELVQLTDSKYGDFDPCWLPDGRIAFISNRRGGYIRCFALLHVPNYVLSVMDRDGNNMRPLSFYETSEWHPSVNNDGMLVYTRWDYTDRENCLGSNFWITYPDGRNPRAPHGNYPYPWHTFPDNDKPDTRMGRPYTEMNIRSIPSSRKYVLTAAPHHGEAFGALAILDLSKGDDAFMGQLRRLTPYVPFPETEIQARSQYPFGTAWPLSEDFFLCNWWENLYLLDRFGNRNLIVENPLCFAGAFQPSFRLIDPIPCRPRKKPPVIPDLTGWNQADEHTDNSAAVAVMDVYDSDLPLPEGVEIRWIRVIQNILKENPWMGVPMMGYQNENTPRIPLGIAPVESDGSAFFEVPPGKELIFQLLDERRMAVQSMRTVAYAHPKETLTCMGCHENTHSAPFLSSPPSALQREPSLLQPELNKIQPVSYHLTVRPILEKTCLACHAALGKGPSDLSWEALQPFIFYFAGGMSRTTTKPIHGGSRSVPGRCGARVSQLGRILISPPHAERVSEEEVQIILLWLDCNAPRLTAFHEVERQLAGKLVWPRLDVDPTNPLRMTWKWGTDLQ